MNDIEVGGGVSETFLAEDGVARAGEGRVRPVDVRRVEDDVERDGRLPLAQELQAAGSVAEDAVTVHNTHSSLGDQAEEEGRGHAE